MIVQLKNREQADAVHWAIQAWVARSRFTARVDSEYHPRYREIIKIDLVRKRKSAPYCGQHPNECLFNTFFTKRERNSTWLEGSDWVGWNDGLNSVFDALGIEADIWSYNRECSDNGRYYIRKGRERRVEYDSVERCNGDRVFYHWKLEGRFEDWCGREAPCSDFPDGTPGFACWSLEDERLHQLEDFDVTSPARISGERTIHGHLILGDKEISSILVTQTQALGLLTSMVSDAEPEYLKDFVNRLYADTAVLGIGDILATCWADQTCMVTAP